MTGIQQKQHTTCAKERGAGTGGKVGKYQFKKSVQDAFEAAGAVMPPALTLAEGVVSRAEDAKSGKGNRNVSYWTSGGVLYIHNHDGGAKAAFKLEEQPKSMFPAFAQDVNSQRKFARELFKRASYAPALVEEHPYCQMKKIESDALYGNYQPPRVETEENGGRLLVPAFGEQGEFVCAQTIADDGKKGWLVSGCQPGGSFGICGALYAPFAGKETVYICEGYATANAIWQSTGCAAVCSWGLGNLQGVAEMIRKVVKNRDYVVCADADDSAELREKAASAARAIGARLVVAPGKGGEDFNDLFVQKGAKAVRDALAEGAIDMSNAAVASLASAGTVSRDNAHEVAAEILSKVSVVCGPSDDFYIYRDKSWVQISERQLRPLVVQHIPENTKMHIRAELMGHIRDLIIPSKRAIEFNVLDKHEIPFLDGVYDALTGELRQHRKEDMLDTLIPHKSPRGDEGPPHTLLRILGDQQLSDAEVAAVQEYFGYCLLPHALYKKALFVVGVGDTGKSTLLDALESIVGSENVSAVSLSSLGNPRKMAPLQGKLVNIVPESDGSLSRVGFKSAVSGGDTVMIDKKHLAPTACKLIAKHVYASNDTPEFDIEDNAVWERVILIKFSHKVAKKDRTLKDKLADELPQVLAWACEGARRLCERDGEFTSSGVASDERETEKSLDYTMQWVESELKPTPGQRVTFKDAWERFCRSSGKSSDNRKAQRDFSRKVKLSGYDIVKSNSRVWVNNCAFFQPY